MLLSKTTIVTWNAKNKKHYVNLGYKFTKMKDDFEVKVEDLTKGSYALLTLQCDYCKKIYQVNAYVYNTIKSREIISKDCCNDPLCTGKKAQETIQQKYQVHSIRDLDYINEKIKKTNMKKYKCENPFGNEHIKNKIKNYYLTHFGVTSSMQLESTKEKSKKTCLKKYGVEHYSQSLEFRERFRGKCSPVWKGNKVKHERSERGLPEYRDWRKMVFNRDSYTCQVCHSRNGNGTYVRLEAHHIKNWAKYIDERFNVNNGITLCDKCHKKFHTIYGKKDNNQQQLNDFILNYNS